MKRHFLFAIGAVSLLAGCQCTPEQAAAPDEMASTDSAEEFAAAIGVKDGAENNTAPGTGTIPAGAPTGTALPPEQLTPVSEASVTRLGKTEGGCRFTANGETVFLAGGTSDIDTSGRAVVVIDGKERVMAGADLGGAQAIESGPTVGDGEYTVSVLRADGAPEEISTGRFRWPADLVITSGAGQRRYPNGIWTCTTGEAA